jgi:tetratricopeptide (TPR) repeat protein
VSHEEARGSLAETPFSHLLIMALDRRWSGALEVGGHVIQLERGAPSRVLAADGYACLGELLCERGIVPEIELAPALLDQGPIGQALVRRGVIDEATLERALKLQVLNRLTRVFAEPPASEWRFLAGDDRFAAMPRGTRVDPLRVLWAGIEAHGDDPARIDEVLSKLGDRPLSLHPDAKLERFGFQGDALAVTTVILADEPTLAELLAAEGAPRELCRIVVYVLSLARSIAADQVPEPISSRPSATDSSTSQKVMRIQLKKVAVSKSAIAGEEIAQAEIARADAAVGDPSIAEEEPVAVESEEPPESRLSAIELHERALYALSRNLAPEAMRWCELACAREPARVDFQATSVWIRAQLPRPDLKVLALDLDDIVRQDGECVAARFYRGMLRRRLGAYDGAKQDFERVLLLDPNHAAAGHQLTELSRR